MMSIAEEGEDSLKTSWINHISAKLQTKVVIRKM